MPYETPGVYVEEISTLPPSVAEVSTAVPAFLGATEKGPAIARINTLLEYQELFGGPQPTRFTVQTARDPQTGLTTVTSVAPDAAPHPAYLMYYCLSLYFDNGGGSCYVVSVGNYGSASGQDAYQPGLDLLEKEDEPTLIVLTDAVNLSADDYHPVCQKVLAQCAKLGDRFAILDVPHSTQDDEDDKVDKVKEFRDGIQTANLKYGAAYHPFLKSSLTFRYDAAEVDVRGEFIATTLGEDCLVVIYGGDAGDEPKVSTLVDTVGADVDFSLDGRVLKINNIKPTAETFRTGAEIAAAWDAWKGLEENDPAGFDVVQDGNGDGEVPNIITPQALELQTDVTRPLVSLETSQTSLYNQIKTAMTAQRVVLPPSAAMAGVYARVDRERGVWKAPANVSLASVIAPVTKITHAEQAKLNLDPTAGKSINAIREFTGKGVLVWGARTLAGNDNEWRYVPVRRLFNMIEESSRKATSFAVFEPNDATTWLKVKGMLESFLHNLWERGALAGPTPESAYFVNVGLGKTMTPQDVLEGRMIVELGIAAVRPAEFIILRFTHKMQEA